MHFPRLLRSKKIFFLFLILLLLVPAASHTARKVYFNRKFNSCIEGFFTADVSSNALSLHYTLANPEEYGITNTDCSMHTLSLDDLSNDRLFYENRLALLKEIPTEWLSEDNRLTMDILMLSYETELLPGNQPLLYEFLGPMIGTQAQLPVLLAEYTFRSEQDVQDYLNILHSVPSYFDSLLSLEEEKAKAGTSLNDETIDRIIAQCLSFIENPEENYLHSVFCEKLTALSGITEAKEKAYTALHKRLISEHIIPAYEEIIDRLTALKGKITTPAGLAHFAGGKEYYEYLLKSDCGLYESVEEIQSRLLSQLEQDLSECREILSRRPELTLSAPVCEYDSSSPGEMLDILKSKIAKDFPKPPRTDYSVKYVPEDLAEYLSPAFYLTPPVDTLEPNDIYINSHAGAEGLELFTTLGHEGYPGHLYQTTYFASLNPSGIRHILNMSGYIEGWATYCESYAYSYASEDADSNRLAWLNRSLNLCLYCLLDIGIHYEGWLLADTGCFLTQFGFDNAEIQKEIYLTILETPANYLKYYMGCLHFQDLRDSYFEKAGNTASLLDFHENVLKIGPCQFPILESYLYKKIGMEEFS